MDDVSPLGGRRGIATELTVHGSALAGNPRLVAPFRFTVATPAPLTSDACNFRTRVTVDAGTPLGVYPVRVMTDAGLSHPFALAVGQLPQIRENEDNSTFETAQPIAIPTIIEGTLPTKDWDWFRFRGRKGQRILVDALSARIGSGFNPSIIRESSDRRDRSGTERSAGVLFDACLFDLLPKDDNYVIGVEGFASNYPVEGGRKAYRLVVGELPAAAEIYPLGGRRGETIRAELRGGTLEGVMTTEVTLQPLPGLSEVYLRVTSAIPGPGGMPLDVESLPPLVVDDLPELLEPNAPDAPPPRAAAPVVFNGRIDPPGDEDRFTLLVSPGQKLRIDVEADDLGSSLYAALQVLDDQGNELAHRHSPPGDSSDSASQRQGQGFRYYSRDPSVEFTVPVGQTEVMLALRSFQLKGELRRKGGVGYAYRIKVVPVVAAFEVALNDAQVSVPRGGAAAVGVTVTRKGFEGPITFRIADPPAGLTFHTGAVAEGQSIGWFTVAAAADADFGPVVLEVIGEGQGADGPVVARANKTITFGEPTTQAFETNVDAIGDKTIYASFPAYLRTRVMTQPGLFAVSAKADPLVLGVPTDPVKIAQGLRTTFKITATRPNGADGSLTLGPLSLPPGLSIPEVKLGERATETTATIKTTRECPPGAVSVVLIARGKIAGVERRLTVPAITIQVVRPAENRSPEG